MDEATSSVDIDTDRRIQELIREEFKEQVRTARHRRLTLSGSSGRSCGGRPGPR
jgi:ABC-type multidrug transport system fused ATPase/permease subunit